MQTPTPSIGTSTFGKVHGVVPMASSSSSIPPVEPGFSSPVQFGGTMLSTRKVLEQYGGTLNMLADASKLAQAGSMLKSTAPGDTGKSPVITPVGSGLPFGEHQLKQLKAQWLVFVTFRNGLKPKKRYLKTALGNMFPEEDIPMQTPTPSIGTSTFVKVHGGIPAASSSSSIPPVELGFSSPVQFGGTMLSTRNVLEQYGGTSNMSADESKLAQAGTILKSTAPRDTRKSPVIPPVVSGFHFDEHQLKQLRAQCIVFLAFRNGSMPKKLHLEIALGNIFPKEGDSNDGTRKELVEHRGKVESSSEPNNVPDAMMPFGRTNSAGEREAGNLNKLMNPEMAGRTGAANHDLVSRELVPASAVQHGLATERKDDAI